jgi:hypothetical protein
MKPETSQSKSEQHLTIAVAQGIPLGHGLPLGISEEKELKDLGPTIEAVLADPLKLMALGDRVYDLYRQDMLYQVERSRGYGRRI